MYRSIKLSLLFLTISFFSRGIAWEGVDSASGDSVEIESGNLVREGEQIEYNSSDGDTHSLDVLSMDRLGNTVTIDGIDSETGDSRTLEMED